MAMRRLLLRSPRPKSLQTFVLAVVTGMAGCSAAENGIPNSIGDGDDGGGTTSTGGVAGAGGSPATGGTAPSGGVTSTGGSVATGGVVSTGGTFGGAMTGGTTTGGTTAGGTSSGGTAGAAIGGTPSTGGTAGAGGGGAAIGGMAGASGGRGGGAGLGGAGSGGRATGGAGAGGKAGTGGTGGKAGAGGTGGKAGAGGGPSGGAGAGGGASCSGTPLSGGTQRCSSNASGNVGNGYAWTIWSSGSGGCMTPYGVGAAFKANWNNSGDFLARVGLNLGSNRRFDQFGTISADYAQTKSGTAGGYSYIGIYGWSVNPLHEYYIIDDWYGTRPSFAGDKVGEVTVDGGTYDILTHTQVNQPAITGGNATFVQFWSLRQSARQCGRISVSEHFRAWAAIGLTLGNMVEVKILAEAGGGVGSIDFTHATVTAQ
jgi:endo-1,4-beta-xylanase